MLLMIMFAIPGNEWSKRWTRFPLSQCFTSFLAFLLSAKEHQYIGTPMSGNVRECTEQLLRCINAPSYSNEKDHSKDKRLKLCPLVQERCYEIIRSWEGVFAGLASI